MKHKSVNGLILGRKVQVDRSGIGNCWKTAYEMPANIVSEIECEIIDGNKSTCDKFVASNGMAYRWGLAFVTTI